jgi:1-acyl-sn-glycerol-3-phosphate acyltransferase
MGKASLFRGPAGSFISWLGGLPIDRSKANSVVSQAIRYINENDHVVIGVAPEGTRKKVAEWKKGFYYIANGAGVPIATTYVDYRRKAGGFGPTLTPTGDMDLDIQTIRTFYASVTGKRRAADAVIP